MAAMRRARTVYANPHQTDGAPRVNAELRRGGERHGCKRVARLVLQAGLVGPSHSPGAIPTTRRDDDAGSATDPLNRRFTAPGPNHLWVVDTTCMPAAAGFWALAIAMAESLFSPLEAKRLARGRMTSQAEASMACLMHKAAGYNRVLPA